MSATFQFDNPNAIVLGVEKLLRSRGEAIRAVPERAVRRGTFELLALVQKKVPKKTSTLVRSITAVVRRIAADLIEGKVGTPMAYARYLEEGTGIYGPNKTPIVIVPKGKKALFWGAYNEGGKPWMAKRVVQKGIKPLAPFATAIAEFIPRYADIVEEELKRAAA